MSRRKYSEETGQDISWQVWEKNGTLWCYRCQEKSDDCKVELQDCMWHCIGSNSQNGEKIHIL